MSRRGQVAGNRGQGSKWAHPPTRRRIYWSAGFRCIWCQKSCTHREITLDHVLPRSLGGTNAADNLVVACMHCNRLRGNATVMAFAERIGTLWDPPWQIWARLISRP